MRKSMLTMALVTVLALLFLTGCQPADVEPPEDDEPAAEEPAMDEEEPAEEPAEEALEGSIVVAGWPAADDAFDAILPAFQEAYPGIEVSYEMQEVGDHHTRLLTALAAGDGAADVVMIESAHIGKFRDRAGLVNLFEAPYNAQKYDGDFVDYKWEVPISVEGDRMIGLPWDIGPLSLFYRRDLFEAAGLPGDPAGVEELLSSWDGYLEAARALHVPGERWIVNSATDIFMVRWSNRDFYDEELNFRFDTDESLELLEVAATVRNEGLDAQVAMWGGEFQTLMAEGQLASVISGSWFGGFLKTWLSPEGEGLWGVARGPVEATNWGGSFLAIPEQSDQKEAGWAFVEFALADADSQNAMFEAVDYFPAYLPAYDDPLYEEEDAYFGGQKTRKLWTEIALATEPALVTPMDQQTEDLLGSAVETGLDQGLSPEEIIESAKEEILNATRHERATMEGRLERAAD